MDDATFGSDMMAEKALGMSMSKARARLQRVIILEMAKKLGYDICHKCNFKIEKVEDMCIDHRVSHIELEKPELFWDMDNIKLAHDWCVYNSGGKYADKYVGIHDYHDNRNGNRKYVRAQITINSKSRSMGYFKTPEEAAIAYDLAIMVFRKGVGVLNFDSMRSEYLEYVDNDDIFCKIELDNEGSIYNTRLFSNKSKVFVDHFYKKLIKARV